MTTFNAYLSFPNTKEALSYYEEAFYSIVILID